MKRIILNVSKVILIYLNLILYVDWNRLNFIFLLVVDLLNLSIIIEDISTIRKNRILLFNLINSPFNPIFHNLSSQFITSKLIKLRQIILSVELI